MNNADILVKDDEIDRYEQAVQAFRNQQVEGDRFMAMRLQQEGERAFVRSWETLLASIASRRGR